MTTTTWGVVPYLSPDGMFLTLYDSGQITVLRYQANYRPSENDFDI